jgi:hypothetical protein
MIRVPRQSAASRRSGAILLIVMVLLLVTMSIALAVFQATIVDARQFRTDACALQADRLAEAGLERAQRLAGSNASFRGDEWNVELPGGDRGRVVTHIEETSDGLAIEAVATFPIEGTRSVRARRGHPSTHSAP